MQKIIKYLYDFDEIDKTYIIKISAPQYTALFNKLDYYPIRKRDINDRVISYIEDCSTDIPLNKKTKIVIKIQQEQDTELEQRARFGLYHNFMYLLNMYKKNSREVINGSIFYVFIFFLLTFAGIWFESIQMEMNKIFFDTMLTGLSIGSWVFLWEAIANIVFSNSKNRNYIKIYKRLVLSKLCFTYEVKK